MGFISLHNHCYASNIRFLDSINRPEEMVQKAIDLGFSGIAFTDHESLSAAVTVLKIRDSIKEAHPEFKIIFGNEIYLIDEKDLQQTKDFYHFILLAKDLEGWQQLKTLSSRAWEREYFERGIMRTPTTYQDIEEIVGKNPGHLIGCTSCLGGELDKKILSHDVSRANQFVKWCISVFGRDNFALELQPADSEEQTKVNPILVKLAKHYRVPFIVTTDSHYLNKEDAKIHSIYLNSKQSKDRETEKFYKYTYIMSVEEMKEVLRYSDLSEEDIEAAISNTELFTKDIQDFDFRHSTIVPKIKIPPFTFSNTLLGYCADGSYPFIKKFYESDDEQDRFLMYQIEEGVKKKNINLTEERLDRINTELDILDYLSNNLGQKLSAYLNLTIDIINIAWDVSLVGCGRGSSCGFFINYLIGITQVNPLEYNLPYWRFLNKERVELPDVDADFQPEKTEDITKLLRNKYGENCVLNCATFKTESLKSCILRLGKGLGYNNDDMQALAAFVPSHRGQNYTLKECLEGDQEKGFEPVEGFKEKFSAYPGLFEAVQKIEGLPSNASIHASALYVFNESFLKQNSLMRAPNGTKITAFSMHDSDDMGALKMDVLRTDAQSKMAKCLELLIKGKEIKYQGSLRKTYDKYIHPDVLDYDNPEMWKKACNGEITNLFQMDSMVGAVTMKKGQPQNVRELAELNSIMRLQSEDTESPIDRYVKFTKDPKLWDKEMQEQGLTDQEMQILHKYLDQSHGVSSSQEVLMQILMDPEITNFTLGQANKARKAIAKKQAQQIIQLKKDFYNTI